MGGAERTTIRPARRPSDRLRCATGGDLRPRRDETEFRFGLDLILDGLERLRDAPG